MKYVIDKKKNEEKLYTMNITCEICMNEDGELAPKSDCNTCSSYYESCHNYKQIHVGKIGTSFLEFISMDFGTITQDLIELFHKSKNEDLTDIHNKLEKYLKPLPYYIHLLGVRETFDYCINMSDKIPDLSPEKAIKSSFDELIIIQKIVSAYADNRYFVEPYTLLQAINEYNIMFCPSTYIPNLGDDYYSFKENPITAIKEFAKECSKKRGNIFEFANFRNTFGVAFDWIVSNNYKISRCENCGKFFVPYNRYDTKYCTYPFKNGKSCRELSFSINVDNNNVLKEYRKIYKTKHAWMNRNKENHITAKDDFVKWHKAAKVIVDKYKLGSISEEECLKWLNDNK